MLMKIKLKQTKKNKYFISNKGTISIVILVIGVVIVIGAAAVVSFMFRDIIFTKVDEEKLKALNFAEAGISNIYTNIERYYNDEISELPSSPYSGKVLSGGEDQGSYIVTYEEYEEDKNFAGYIITSKGIDKNGTERTIKVKLKVESSGTSDTFNIFDYTYSKKSVYISYVEQNIFSPFYTGGDLTIKNNEGLDKGPVLVGDDLRLRNNGFIKGGPVNVFDYLDMRDNSNIDDDLENPLIVNGNIRMSHNSYIGQIDKKLKLAVGGTITTQQDSRIYNFTLIDETFKLPEFDLEKHIKEIEDNIKGTALKIDGNLIIKKDNYFNLTDGKNTLSFSKEGSDYILKIKGNIIVNGEVQIGENFSYDKQYIIKYDGKGIFYSTKIIRIYSRLIPLDVDSFPEEDLLVLVTKDDIMLIVIEAPYIDSDCDNPDVFIAGIALDKISLYEGVTLKGCLAAGSLSMKNYTTICHENGIRTEIPSEIPQPPLSSGKYTFTQEWQEIINE